MSDASAADFRPGMQLPDVTLQATSGGLVGLAALKGRSVLAVYPWTGRSGLPNPPGWNDIPGAHGSTPELEGFRDLAASFAAAKVKLFGLSRQTIDYQREMAERLKLPFTILSDAEGRFSAALGLPSFTAGGEIYLRRMTLILDSGRIVRVFFPVEEPALHGSSVLAVLQSESSSASSTE